MLTLYIILVFLFIMRVLRKAACRPLALRGSSKTHQSSLTLKGGSTSHLGLLPSGKKRKPLLSIVFTTPSVPLVGDRNVALNHFILWLADHQRSTPVFLCGMNRMDTRFRMFAACSMLKGCLLDACCLLELLFEGTADKMDGALRNLLILSSYSP